MNRTRCLTCAAWLLTAGGLLIAPGRPGAAAPQLDPAGQPVQAPRTSDSLTGQPVVAPNRSANPLANLPLAGNLFVVDPYASRALLNGRPVDLDLNELPIAEAVKQLIERSGAAVELQLSPELPGNTRVSLRAKGIQPATALDALAQAIGRGWDLLTGPNGKSLLRFGTPPSGQGSADASNPFLRVLTGSDYAANNRLLNLLNVDEQRFTFKCPHCKESATVLRRNQQPLCPGCKRLFQAEWQFCPFDGTRRPAAPNEWQFCPHCGKAVAPASPAGARGDYRAVPDPVSPNSGLGRRF